MKISASFLSSYYIEQDIMKLNETDVDFIHVDVMDGKFVKNKTLPFRAMKNIYKFTSKRLDVHLMASNPKKLIKKYAQLNTEYITIHVELKEDIEDLIDLIHNYGIKCGLSLKPTTPIEELNPYLDKIDMVLFMAVEPGEGGQQFIPETLIKIKEFKKKLKEEKRNIVINVDGGINLDNCKKLRQADILVSGSCITSSEDFQKTITRLRGGKNE